jgi:hypothetical protein
MSIRISELPTLNRVEKCLLEDRSSLCDVFCESLLTITFQGHLFLPQNLNSRGRCLTHQDCDPNFLHILLTFVDMKREASQMLRIFLPADIFATEGLRAKDGLRQLNPGALTVSNAAQRQNSALTVPPSNWFL